MGASTITPSISPAGAGSATITLIDTWSDSHRDYRKYRIDITAAAGYKIQSCTYSYSYIESLDDTTITEQETIVDPFTNRVRTTYSFEFVEDAARDYQYPPQLPYPAFINYTLTALSVSFAVDVTQYYTISTSVNPAGSGTTTGAGTYAQGASCTVTATPANGFVFAGWYESGVNVSNAASYTFTVSASRSLVAQFVTNPSPTEYRTIAAQSKSYGLNPLTQQPIYHGDVQINSRARSKSDSASLQCQTTYTLTAYPDNGWRFKRWVRLSPSSPAKEDANNPYSAMVTLTPETWEAEFEQMPTPTYCTVDAETWVAAQGDVQINSGNISDRESASIQVGTTAIIRAIPAAGYAFDHWEIDHNGATTTSTDREYSLTPAGTSGYWFTAYFKARTHLLVNSSDRLVPAMLVYAPTTNLLVADY